jgi:hypothetical protein
MSAKHWTFTLNNYTNDEVAALSNAGPPVSYIIYGKEVSATGTPHLQGFVSFSARRRLGQVKALIGQRAHVEVARIVANAIEYCKKDGDFTEHGTPPTGAGNRSDLDAFKEAVKSGIVSRKELRETHSEVFAKYARFCVEYLQDNEPQKDLPTHPLHDWQQELSQRLNGEPDDRTIVFVVDPVGNKGKSWFAHYYAMIHDRVQVMEPAKKADMSYALDSTIRVLFIDAPRSRTEYVLYDFLEAVKNGFVFSPKYESRTKTLNKCHVVCLMNEYPDMTKLSADRYHIINLN